MILFPITIVKLILDTNISQNEYLQCVENILNAIMRKKLLKLANFYFILLS